VEEIHTTLRKHLAKEEAQLLPLLLKHFSCAEQAELVAQFLYCIPLATVEQVLAWLKPSVPQWELVELMDHLQQVISDTLLQQLLVNWLNPGWPTPGAAAVGAAAGAGAISHSSGVGASSSGGGAKGLGGSAGGLPAADAGSVAPPDWPPLRVSGTLGRVTLK
jgi:zinc finger-like protein